MTYQIDPKHSGVHFQVRHMTIANVKGEFGNIEGTVEFDPANPGASKIDAKIPMDAIYTRDAARDGHLKSADLLNAEAHPLATFKSKSVSKDGSGYKIVGDLTLRGTTGEVTLNVTHVSDEVTDPWSLKRRGITATGTFLRSAFGMGWNMDLPGVGKMVSDEVDLTLDIQITRTA
jgi:polyisoprenoid-binding protein YceI